MDEEKAAPEWLKPGAKVVVWSENIGPRNDLGLVETTVKKIAGQSFTVVDGRVREPRFYIGSLRSARQGGDWSGYYRHVAPRDSEKGREMLALHRKRRAVSIAERQVQVWAREHNEENLKNAIKALEQVQRLGAGGIRY